MKNKHYHILKYGRIKNGKEFKAKVLVEYTVASKFYFETAWCILLGVRIIDRKGDDIVEFQLNPKMALWRFKGPLSEGGWTNIVVPEEQILETQYIEDENSAKLVFEVGDD